MSTAAYIGLGANDGDRIGNLRRAVALLDESSDLAVVDVSPVYETEAAPPCLAGQPDFLNAVIRVSSRANAGDLLDLLLTVEAEIGRVREAPGDSRPIDLDLLLFGDAVIDRRGLVVPHPGMNTRRFVLEPLLDVWPEASDPTTGSPLADALTDAPTLRCDLRPHLSLWSR